MSCPSCYNNPLPCDCGCNATPVPNPEPIPIVCPDPEPCDQAIDSHCVIYTGGDLPCIGIAAGDPPIIRLNEILEKLDIAVCESGLSITFVADSDCISLTGQGTQLSPIVATPIIDNSNPNNILTCTENGLSAIVPTDVLTNVVVESSNCVNLQGVGTVADPLTASLLLDDVSGNLLECTVDGLKATINTQNSSCISLSGNGTSGDKLTASAIVDTASDNLLECGVDGLIAKVNIQSSNCIDFSGTGVVGDPLIPSLVLDGDSLLCTDKGLQVNPSSLDFLTFNNGLTRTLDVVQLGGDLLKNTSINLTSYYFKIASATAGNYAKFLDSEFKTTYSVGTSPVNLATILDQTATEFNVIGTYYSNITSGSYNANVLFQIDANSSYARIGSSLPVGAYPITQDSSMFYTFPYQAFAQSYNVSLYTPGTTINSGGLQSGIQYIITNNSGGANFIPSGAANNTVGTVFTSIGVTPMWGTGELEIYGTVNQISSYANTTLTRRKFDILAVTDSVLSPVSNVNDFGIISTYNPGYYETQTFSSYKRSLTSYITEGLVALLSGATTTSSKFAKVGVSVPTTNDLLTPAPDNIPQTAYTQWFSYDGVLSGTDYGIIRNFAPYHVFSGLYEADGITPVVNSGYARVGINVDAATLDTVTTTLNVSGPDNTPHVNVKKDYAPATAVTTGKKGDITWGEDGGVHYVYVCVSTNTWKRVALSTWV